MGNKSSSHDERFLNDWVQIERQGQPNLQSNLWALRSNQKVQMEQYNLHLTSKDDVQSQRRVHQLRHNHPQLVSSLYFKDETQQQFCSSNYKGKIFIERIPLTLQTVTDIPFPDALHVYSQSLQGFHILASQVQNGCFPISQQHIGISSQSVCKVWMNNKYDRNYPSRNQRIPQERMVAIILDTIQQNVDLGNLNGKPSPKDYIYSKSKSPSNVRFGQAINLVRHYANQFFGGVIPQKLSCVDKVGGAFLLSKNWKTRNNENVPQTVQTNNYGYNNFNSVRTVQNQPNQYSYTAFKREQPLTQTVVTTTRPIQQNQNTYRPVPVQPINLQRSNIQNTPNFNHPPSFGNSQVMVQQQPLLSGSKIVISQQPPRAIQQIVYTNQTTQYRPQTVQTKRSMIKFSQVVVPPSEMKESLIQNRFVNTQVNPTPIKVLSQPNFAPVQNVNFIPQAQVVQVQPQVIQQVQQPAVNPIKRSVITFNGQTTSVQNQSQVVNRPPTNEPVPRAFSNYIMPNPQSGIQINDTQKVDSKLVFLQRSPPKPHLRNNQQSISSINAQTNQIKSNQILSDKFSLIKQQPLDNSTRNFYNNNFLNQNTSNVNDYSTSYYQNYTSKLYDNNQEDVKQVPTSTGKYNVNLDDGMSSAAFLNQLKTMKFSTTSPTNALTTGFTKKTDNYDFGTTYQTVKTLNKYTGQELQQTYKVDYQTYNYKAHLDDAQYGVNNNNDDLIVVGQRIQVTPVQTVLTSTNDQNNRLNLQDQNQYRLSYQYEQGQTPAGDVKYESQYVRVQNQDGTGYEQQYYVQADYQSTFDRYAKYNQYNNTNQQQQQRNYTNQIRFGQNLQTQMSRNNPTQEYYYQVNNNSKNSANTTAYQHQTYSNQSPSKNEEYKVDFDPQILADLQKLKGVN